MSISPKRMVFVSMIAAGLVGGLAILDLALAIPFGRATVMDILFVLSAGIVVYLAWETYRELA